MIAAALAPCHRWSLRRPWRSGGVRGCDHPSSASSSGGRPQAHRPACRPLCCRCRLPVEHRGGGGRFPRGCAAPCRGRSPYDGDMSGYHPAVEEYLETILELEESGILPMRARIVERLGVSAPAVSETVKRLEREGYLTLGSDRVMSLTESGRSYGTAIMRRHRLAERLLTDVLGVPWHQVHEQGHQMEHAISANLERHLVALLGDPATCPHGNPIPGSANAVDTAARDSSGPVSTAFAEPGIGLPCGQVAGSPSRATRWRSRLALIACSSRPASSCTWCHGTPSTSVSSRSANRCRRMIAVP